MERTKVVPVQAGEIFDKKLFLMYYKCSSHASVEDSLNLCPLLAGAGVPTQVRVTLRYLVLIFILLVVPTQAWELLF